MRSLFFLRLAATTLLSMAVFNPVYAKDSQPIPRETGAVQAEFMGMLAGYLKNHKAKVGRIHIQGNNNQAESCEINLYINQKYSFVTLMIAKGRDYTEFYIDHPNKSFRNIMFQKLTKTNERTELSVIKRKSEFTLTTENERLAIRSKNHGNNPLQCQGALSSATFFAGETE